MTVPGSNLLSRASRLIALQPVQWSAWQSSVTGASGVKVATYAAPVTIRGSVQAVPRSMYEAYGLDFQRTYVLLFTTQALKDLQRDQTPDRIDFNGSRYAVESNTDWQWMDGWQGSILIRTGATP